MLKGELRNYVQDMQGLADQMGAAQRVVHGYGEVRIRLDGMKQEIGEIREEIRGLGVGEREKVEINRRISAMLRDRESECTDLQKQNRYL